MIIMIHLKKGYDIQSTFSDRERIKQYFFTPISLLEYKKHYCLVVKFHCSSRTKSHKLCFSISLLNFTEL